jgi:hypothetical protein
MYVYVENRLGLLRRLMTKDGGKGHFCEWPGDWKFHADCMNFLPKYSSQFSLSTGIWFNVFGWEKSSGPIHVLKRPRPLEYYWITMEYREISVKHVLLELCFFSLICLHTMISKTKYTEICGISSYHFLSYSKWKLQKGKCTTLF